MSRVRLRIGDIFTVPLDDERVGFGQVVATYLKEAYYFTLFEPAFERSALPEIGHVLEQPIAFLALSFDAKFHAGHWVVVGNREVAADLPLPAFKEMVGDPERVDVVDYSGHRRRTARGREAEWLHYRDVVAPVRLEKALRALHGLEPWVDAYDGLRPSPATTTARLFD